ncbi:MAG TPA: hypothetical protein VGM88_21615 [Kofleriaceae bacterium]|jgi:hypothetical protein
MIEIEVLRLAHANDPEARKTLVAAAGLKGARAVLGTPKEHDAGLRELVDDRGPAPALAYYLASTDDAPRTSERVRRARVDRWGPAERDAIARFVALHGARLGAEEAVEQIELLATYPDGVALATASDGAWEALAETSLEADEHVRLQWQPGFQILLAAVRAPVPPALLRWIARPVPAKIVARALFASRERGSVMAAIDAMWAAAQRQDVFADAIADATSQSRGMAGRDELVAWSWARFCARPAERVLLYRAFRPWRDLWIEQRNQMPREVRPGGESAIAHLLLWGSLDLEKLSETVDEAVRLALPGDWVGLVDAAMDLATAPPRELQLHALAGACRMSFEVRNRAMDGDAAIEPAATRYLARADALTSSLRSRGILDQWIANRVTDLEDSARMIREAREKRAGREREIAEREQQRLERERQQEAQRRETEARIAEAKAEAAARMALFSAMPRPPHPIDHELFFPQLPVASVYAYARMFKMLQKPNGMQSLAAEGVSPEMLAAVTTAWSSLFATRPELAQRFSTLLQELP